MTKSLGALLAFAFLLASANAQADEATPGAPPATPPITAPPDDLPPRRPPTFDRPGARAPGAPQMPMTPPLDPSGARAPGAQMPLTPPPAPDTFDRGARPSVAPQPASAPASAGLISFLEAATPVVQAFDVLLMLFCGIYCLRSLRRRKNAGVTILAISCFVAAIILLGFFLSAAPNGKPLFPLGPGVRMTAYAIARILAPFELLLFALGIIFVARANRSS